MSPDIKFIPIEAYICVTRNIDMVAVTNYDVAVRLELRNEPSNLDLCKVIEGNVIYFKLNHVEYATNDSRLKCVRFCSWVLANEPSELQVLPERMPGFQAAATQHRNQILQCMYLQCNRKIKQIH
jgi:hypothetical protein